MAKFSTLTQLAELLSVSPSTVSRALNNHPRISQKTKDLVKSKAEEVGYTPNIYSNVLRTKRTYLIGLIVPDVTLHFYSRVVKAIEEQVWVSNYSIVLVNCDERVEKERKAIDHFISLRVDGVMAALTTETKKLDHYEKLVNQGIPLVFYDRVANFLPAPKVVMNDYQASYDATSHLVKTGCRTIAHITASKNLNNSNNRLYGYLDALKDHGMKIIDDLIFYYEFDHSLIRDFLSSALHRFPELDGIFVFNDYAAYTTVQFLFEKGKLIPEEISVIGFSGEPISTYMTPKLSTAEDIAEQMGIETARKLQKIIETGENSEEKIILKQKLILRETTRNP